ncbi:MAG: hypothetical protein JJT88_13705 [Gammaproteobacteria bacterium]|nr:hypothetical protein [Gammaproteobacteria bacterium]
MSDTDLEPARDLRSIRLRIVAKEQALRLHRTLASDKAKAIRTRIRGRMTSPVTLMVAAGIGFTLGKRGSNRSRKLIAPLKIATHASLLLRALMPKAPAVTEPVEQP